MWWQIDLIIPDDLGGEAEPRPLLPRGDGERLSFPAGLMEVSGWWSCFRGGVLDILFIAFLGEREPEELLPEDEAERERLLQDTNASTVSAVQCRVQWEEKTTRPSCAPRPNCDWPADRGTPVSVSGAGGSTSWGTPPSRRHPPPWTLPSTRGVWSDGEETRTWFYTKQLKPRTGGHRCTLILNYLERERRLREREWERERWWGLSLLLSFSLSRDLGLSSFLWVFSMEGSLTSVTESAFTTSTTVSLQTRERKKFEMFHKIIIQATKTKHEDILKFIQVNLKLILS